MPTERLLRVTPSGLRDLADRLEEEPHLETRQHRDAVRQLRTLADDLAGGRLTGPAAPPRRAGHTRPMIVLGVILLLLGLLLPALHILFIIGLVVVVVGLVLLLLGGTGHPVGGRRHYW